jgi:hypothetical protein
MVNPLPPASMTSQLRQSIVVACVVIAAGLSSGSCQRSSVQSGPSPVSSPLWTLPVALEGMPANSLMRWPILTTFRDTVYVASNIYPIAGTSVVEHPIYLARLPGGVIAAPAGNFQFVYPKIVAAPNGDVHLVWAEFDSIRHDALTWGDGFQTALWHSVFRNGSWSPAEEILRSTALQWTQDDGHVAIDRAGALHAVVWAVRGQQAGVVRVHRDASGWRAEPISGATRPPAAIEAIGDSLLIAFVGDSFQSADTTGVTVLRSSDHGVTWSKPVVVQRMGGRFAWHPQFVPTEKGTLLLWVESAPGRFSRDTLRVVRLGESLRPTPVASLSLPPGSATYSVAAMPCGEVSILVGTIATLLQTLEVTIGAGGAVSQRWVLPDHRIAAFSGIGAIDRGFVAVLARGRDPAAPATPAVMTRPGCLTAR